MANATPITTTYLGECPCGCGDAVAVDLGTFADTSATVKACAKLRATGILDYTVRKSGAPVSASPAAAVRHSAGLVWMGA